MIYHPRDVLLIHLSELDLLFSDLIDAFLLILFQFFKFGLNFFILLSDLIQFLVMLLSLLFVFLMGNVHCRQHLIVNFRIGTFHLILLETREDVVKIVLRDVPNAEAIPRNGSWQLLLLSIS